MPSRDLIVPCRIAVAAVPRKGVSLALTVAAGICLMGAVATFTRGQSVPCVACAAGAFAFGVANHFLSRKNHAFVETKAAFLSYEDKLVLVLPGTRLWKGTYVDQHYLLPKNSSLKCSCNKKCLLLIEASMALSRAVDGDTVLDQREIDAFEIMFQVQPDAIDSLKQLIGNEGGS